MSDLHYPPARRGFIRRKNKPRDPLLVYLSKALAVTITMLICAFFVLTRFTISIDPQYYAGIESSLPWAVWITDTHNKDVTYGDYLAFETDDRMLPYFTPGTGFVKEVVGLPGDHVVIKAGKVSINGQPVGTINLAETLHRPVASFDRDTVIAEDHYWVMGTSPISFDSRYWGTVSQEQVIGESWHLWPLFVGPDSEADQS